MIVKHLSDLITMMAACDDRCTYDFDLPWPLHRALAELAKTTDTMSGWPWSYEVGLVDHAGNGVPELEGAVMDAVRDGSLEPDTSRPRRQVVSWSGRLLGRRLLMTLEPEIATAVYRTALLWATASSTLSKNLDTAEWSAELTYDTRPPKRLHPLPVR